MALQQFTAEGGTPGANLVVNQTGSGDPLSLVQVTNGSTLTFDSTRAMHGTKSILVTPTATGQAQIGYTVAGSAVAARLYLYLTALPTADTYFLRYETGAAATTAPRFVISNTGKAAFQDGASTKVWNAANTFPLNQWVRVEMYCVAGTTTTNGTIKGGIYLGDSTTPIEAVYASTAANAQTAPYTRISALKTNGSQTYATAYGADSFAASDTATDFIGPYVAANVAPSANAGADQANVEPWSTVTLTGAASDSDGTIASSSWTQTGGTAVALVGTGLTRTFTAPAKMGGDTLTFQLSVTDNAGATSTDTVVVSVLTATEFIRKSGAWVPCRLMRRSGGTWV